MNFNEYQVEAMKNKVYGYGDKITYPTLGLANEAGEVAGKVKKVLRDYNGDYNAPSKDTLRFNGNELVVVPVREGIADELGDVLWYLAAVADDLGYDLETIAQMNITKLTSRRERGVIQGSGDNR